MPHGKYAECPKCGKIAWNDDIEIEFGYRYEGTKPQSWCKECRSLYNSSPCACTDCLWWDEYPECKREGKCPWNDD